MIPSAGIDATLVPLNNDIFADVSTKSRTRDIKPNQQLKVASSKLDVDNDFLYDQDEGVQGTDNA